MIKFGLFSAIIMVSTTSVQGMSPRETRAVKINAAREYAILQQAAHATNDIHELRTFIFGMQTVHAIIQRPAIQQSIREFEEKLNQLRSQEYQPVRGLVMPRRLFVKNPPRRHQLFPKR